MKKKLTILFALLCASVMGFAQSWSGSVVGHVTNVWLDGIGSNEDRAEFDYEVNYLTEYNDGTLTITIDYATANFDKIVGLVPKVIVNGAYAGDFTSKQWSSSSYTAGTTLNIYFQFDYDGGGNGSSQFQYTIPAGGGSTPDPDPDPDPTPSVSPYCEYEVGHFGDPSADVNSFILLSIGSDGHGHTIVNIKQDADKNSNSFDYINVVGIKDIGSDVTTGGKTEMAIIFNTPTPDGDGNIKFTLQWSKVGDGGRWQLNDVTVPATATCEHADPFPGDNTYCSYTDNQLRANNANVALTWSTDVSGNVVIDISDGEGATNSAFRNGGFENEGSFANTWWVYSGTNNSIVESASEYFNEGSLSNDDKRFTLSKKADLPANAIIAFFGHAFSWKNTQAAIAYHEKKYFAYEYGYNCPSLDVPADVAVTDAGVITFTGSALAESYTALVYLDGILKHRQAVTSGATLTYVPYITGTYQVKVTASAEGYPTTDPSDPADWNLTATPIVVGNSEYCEAALPRDHDKDANFSWETDNSGNMTITLLPLSGQTATFREQGMKLADFTVGSNRTAASEYFDRVYSAGGTTVVLNLKNASIKPGQGEPIYFNGYVECTVDGVETWPTANLTYTYGSKCSGQKHVTVAVNDAGMGTATVNGGASADVDAGTVVTCVATPASGYEFVNWTKGGVEVATSLTYTPTIESATDLMANFDYIRTTYCHTAVQTSGDKKLYLTVGKGATEGTYQIKIYGSDELTITGINNANTAMNFIKFSTYDGNDVPLNIANEGWTFSATGYGVITSAEIQPRTGYTWRDMWMWRPDLYIGTDAGEQNINSILSQEHHFNWNNECSDTEAPVFGKAEAEVLNETSVQLKIQATDNWGGLLTYTIARADASDIILNGASGEELTQEITGLTTNTEYDFTITVSDGVNDAVTHIVVTPIADNEKPEMTSASLESKTWNSAIINVAATDNKGVTAYYIVELAAEYVAAEGKITVTGLTAATAYTFTITAKDAAGNESANNAVVAFTTDAHLLAPTTAAPVPTWPAAQVKSIYSDSYSLAPSAIPNYNDCWWDCPNANEGDVEGNNYMLYNLYRNGMIGVSFADISVATMEKIHIDIWASAAGTLSFRPITTGGPNTPKTLTLAAQQWNTFDIDLTEYAGHDWSKVFQYSIEFYQAGGLVGEYIAVDNVYFYRTTPPPADEAAPTDVVASKVEESFASAKISAQANDDSGVVHFKVLNGSTELISDVEAVSGVAVTITVNGLTPNTNYTLSVVAFDAAGHEAEPVSVAVTTRALPSAAPHPTHDAVAVLSVYSDAYTPAVAATFNRTNWGSAPVAIENDYLLYTMSSNVIVWGNNDGNAGHGNIDGMSGYTHDATPGLDVSGMTYVHFDVWCDVDNQLNTVNINDVAVAIPTTRTIAGEWVSFDVDITGVALAERQNVRWMKFHPFTNCNAAIDNVYFWKAPKYTRDDDWMAPGELGTVCYPEGLVVAGATMYKMAGTDANGKFVFDEVSVLEPGVPYLFEAHANALHFYATAAPPATEAGTSNGMVGTFADKVIPQNSPNIYYFSGTKFYAVTARSTDLTVPANRAYVDLTAPHPAGAPRAGVRRVVFDVQGSNAATGFGEVQGDDQHSTKVLIDGHLFIRRGEKTYDATGRLVK